MSKNRIRPLASFIAAVLAALFVKSFMLDLAIVSGWSMYPTLRPGSVVVVLRAAYGFRAGKSGYLLLWNRPKPGDIVVTGNPRTGETVVKRVVTAFPGLGQDEGSLFVMGDNPADSTDSRDYGLVPVESVLGRVLVFR